MSFYIILIDKIVTSYINIIHKVRTKIIIFYKNGKILCLILISFKKFVKFPFDNLLLCSQKRAVNWRNMPGFVTWCVLGVHGKHHMPTEFYLPTVVIRKFGRRSWHVSTYVLCFWQSFFTRLKAEAIGSILYL